MKFRVGASVSRVCIGGRYGMEGERGHHVQLRTIPKLDREEVR